MILHRFFNERLAHASYIVGCPSNGEACVIDPNRNLQEYTAYAVLHGLTIVAVTETHIHADFVSGTRELGTLTDATVYLSDEGDADWKYQYASDKNVRLLKHGDSIRIGQVRLDVKRTPGHTPEHVSFVLTDEATSHLPLGVFSGDFLFVGDVGRPDLLENAVGVKGSMTPAAKTLFESLKSIAEFPDHLLVWPGHGAGSACGKSLGGLPVSSLGYERASNWALKVADEEQFVTEVLTGQPEPPRYFAEMKRLNKCGPSPRPEVHRQPLNPDQLDSHDVFLIDIRAEWDYAQGHLPGSLNLPAYFKSFLNWAGWLVPYDRDFVLVSDNYDTAVSSISELQLIGLDRCRGWFESATIAHKLTEQHRVITFSQVQNELVLDVRSRNEWEAGHVKGSVNIPLGQLPERSGELPKDVPLAVYCQGGGRSPIAASLLQTLGLKNVADVADGYLGYLATQAR